MWYRPAAAALILPLAQERSYDTGAALKKKKKERKLNMYIYGIWSGMFFYCISGWIYILSILVNYFEEPNHTEITGLC